MWALGLTLVWLVALVVFGRFRAKRLGFEERRQFLERFPPWARRVERLVMYGAWFFLALGLSFLFRLLHDRLAGSDYGPGFESVGVMTIGCLVAAMAPAFLLSNLIFMRVPSLRDANTRASEGLPSMTFAAATRDLLMMGAVTAPLGLAQAFFGAYAPWER